MSLFLKVTLTFSYAVNDFDGNNNRDDRTFEI